MRGINAPRPQTYNDFNDLFENVTDVNDNKEVSKFPPCPRITACIIAVPISALIDTGSQITAVSETFYQYLKTYHKVVELPVSNVTILTAIGKKLTHIKKQILCEIQIGSFKSQASFLVIPHLSNQVILGNDWLLLNRVLVDYKSR